MTAEKSCRPRVINNPSDINITLLGGGFFSWKGNSTSERNPQGILGNHTYGLKGFVSLAPLCICFTSFFSSPVTYDTAACLLGCLCFMIFLLVGAVSVFVVCYVFLLPTVYMKNRTYGV